MNVSLKRLLEQAFFYDLGRDFQAFERSVDVATETAKQKFQKIMNTKVLGKKVEIRASRGYGQPEKDHVINKVTGVHIDWYYNKYVVIFKNEDGKEFFLKPGFKVKVIGSAAATPDETDSNKTQAVPQEPEKSQQPSSTNQAAQQPQQQPVVPLKQHQAVPNQQKAHPIKEEMAFIDEYI